MILGVGIDMVKIEKMETAINKWGSHFIDRIFNSEELEKITPGKIYYQRLAARFAAKEAVIKATSKNFSLALKDILILNKENGAPYCKFVKKLDVDVLLSITHIKDYAAACAVAQKI
ncbi:MAG: holo-[acyl-carrier-protein] synthase [Candidatus Omnitrophica bacterium]|nr:holo-[acyl-carrier-protein] synthase [Candidatus Omnitrophota bacterium]